VSEWWSYRLGSFLMFSEATWVRLVASYNRDLWPAHLPALCIGLGALALAWRARAPMHDRLVSAMLGGAWIWVGWAFLHRRFASVNWPAEYLAWAFGLQGVVMLALAAARGGIAFGYPARRGRDAGPALALAGIVALPLATPLFGRPWARVEVFGLMPDPTAIATLGFLLMARCAPVWLFAVPLLACAASAATLRALGTADAWVPAAAAVAAVGVLASRRLARPRTGEAGSA
jgi:hypothetical protein